MAIQVLQLCCTEAFLSSFLHSPGRHLVPAMRGPCHEPHFRRLFGVLNSNMAISDAFGGEVSGKEEC